MYGYIRAAKGELKLREYEIYRAFYCGLCREMGRLTGQISRTSLSYDAAFLAIVRSAVTGDRTSYLPRRCFVHPAKKRLMAGRTDSLAFAACASAVLVRGKLDDTVSDERGAARLVAKSVRPGARRWVGRAERKFSGIETAVSAHLATLSKLEADNCASLDDVSAAFGALVGELASFGTEGSEEMLLRRIGDIVGRFIYVCDACDDAANDLRRGTYNPLIAAYGPELCEKRRVWDMKKMTERDVLRTEIARQIESGAEVLTAQLVHAVDLISFERTPELEGIIRNVICIGMPGELRRVLGLAHAPRASGPDGNEGREEE